MIARVIPVLEDAMAEVTFKFTSSEVANDDYFEVVSFEGTEAISKLFEFEIKVIPKRSNNPAATFMDDVLDSDPCFTMIYENEAHDIFKYPIYGMLAGFDENQTVGRYTHYTATLVPRLWKLSLNRNSQVFVDAAEPPTRTAVSIIEDLLTDAGLDHNIAGIATTELLVRDYRCQFNESDFDFISRLLENEGIYYYFDHSSGVDQIMFSDDLASTAFSSDSELTYDSSPSASKIYESINSWICRKQRLPDSVIVGDYDSENSDQEIAGSSAVGSDAGSITQYTFGENIKGDVDGEDDYIAQIRAEELEATRTRYYGEGGVCGFCAGYTFGLSAHNNSVFNVADGYLITEVTHSGAAEDTSIAGKLPFSIRRVPGRPSTVQPEPSYSNSFVAIDSTTLFRPKRITPVPKFYGTINAFIYDEVGDTDAAGSEIAELNEEGKYRVTLPFTQRDGGNIARQTTHWIRMAQPYVGVNEGLYYPLKNATEVLLTFINGDPDRPVITAALPNSVTDSLLTSANRTESILQTKGPKYEYLGFSSQIQPTIFSKSTIDRPAADTDKIRNTCPPPTEATNHQHTDAPKLGTHIDGNVNILSRGSYVIHAQTQYDDSNENKATDPIGTPPGALPPSPPVVVPQKHQDPWIDGARTDPQQIDKIKFEMLEDRVVLDTGGRDLIVNCNHYALNNESEINDTTGHDHMTHHGTAYELFTGDSEEHYIGNKYETFNGHLKSEHKWTSEDYYYGNKFEFAVAAYESIHLGENLEVFGGLKQEFALASSLEIYGGYKQELSLASCLEAFFGEKYEFALSREIAISTGARIDLNYAANLVYTPMEVDLKDVIAEKRKVKAEQNWAHLKKKFTQLEEIKAAFRKSNVEVKKSTSDIEMVEIKII